MIRVIASKEICDASEIRTKSGGEWEWDEQQRRKQPKTTKQCVIQFVRSEMVKFKWNPLQIGSALSCKVAVKHRENFYCVVTIMRWAIFYMSWDDNSEVTARILVTARLKCLRKVENYSLKCVERYNKWHLRVETRRSILFKFQFSFFMLSTFAVVFQLFFSMLVRSFDLSSRCRWSTVGKLNRTMVSALAPL